MHRDQHQETYGQDMVISGEYQLVSVANKIFDQKMVDNMNLNLNVKKDQPKFISKDLILHTIGTIKQ
jgi:hypothetical protein